MIRLILVGMLLVTTSLSSITQSPQKLAIFNGSAPLTPKKLTHSVSRHSQDSASPTSIKIQKALSLWNDCYIYLQKSSLTTLERKCLRTSLKQVRNLTNTLSMQKQSLTALRRIFKERSEILKFEVIDDEIDLLLNNEWPDKGHFYPKTGIKALRKLSMSDEEEGLESICKNLFPDEDDKSKHSEVSDNESLVQKIKHSPVKESRTNFDSVQVPLLDVKVSKTSVDPRFKLFSFGVVLGVLGYLCVTQASAQSMNNSTVLI